jgi:hypothetical protein
MGVRMGVRICGRETSCTGSDGPMSRGGSRSPISPSRPVVGNLRRIDHIAD